MRSEPLWVSKSAILAIHERLISVHGGATGTLDESRLEAALASPRNHHSYGTRDLFELAAAYAHALTRDHPFRDGNKRVAFMAAAVFLELNGQRFQAPEVEVVVKTVGLAARQIDEKEFARWLRENSKPHRSPKAGSSRERKRP